MRSSTLLLLGASLLASEVLARVSYSAKMTHQGVEVPVNFTTLPARPNLPNGVPGNFTNGKRNSISSTANWAGAMQQAPSSGLFHSISASWNVPLISAPSGQILGADLYWLYEWIGIDSSCGVILQAGTGSYIDTTYGYQNLVWWEWFPSGPQAVNMPINTGDTFFVNITATSTTSAIYFIENQTQDYAITITVSGGSTLCLQNAEWIVENPGILSAPNFTNVYFTNCLATTTTGAKMNVDGTTLIYMNSIDGEVSKGQEINHSELLVYY